MDGWMDKKQLKSKSYPLGNSVQKLKKQSELPD